MTQSCSVYSVSFAGLLVVLPVVLPKSQPGSLRGGPSELRVVQRGPVQRAALASGQTQARVEGTESSPAGKDSGVLWEWNVVSALDMKKGN